MILEQKDFRAALIIGASVGVFAFFPLQNLGVMLTPGVVAASLVGFTVLAPLALEVFARLGIRWPIWFQFGKFAAVGSFNSFLDLAVLNALILLSGMATGWYYVAWKSLAFIVGKNSSYFWNKFWTFQAHGAITGREYLSFVFFTATGYLLNVGVASGVVNFISAPRGITENMWANIGALVGIFVALGWNFFMYRNVVFKPRVDRGDTDLP